MARGPTCCRPSSSRGTKGPVAAPAQDQDRANGVSDGEGNDRGVAYREQRRGEVGFGIRALAEAAAEHDRSGGHRLVEERLPGQPGHRILATDEVGRAARLVAGLDPEHVLIEARQRAAVHLDDLGGKTHESPHDLVRVAAGDEILDRPGRLGLLRHLRAQVRDERARCQSQRAPGAGGCHAHRGVGDI
jgi:hypothetical protein